MFKNNQYLTKGVQAEIPLELQLFMWECINHLPDSADYLQVFKLEPSMMPDRSFQIHQVVQFHPWSSAQRQVQRAEEPHPQRYSESQYQSSLWFPCHRECQVQALSKFLLYNHPQKEKSRLLLQSTHAFSKYSIGTAFVSHTP